MKICKVFVPYGAIGMGIPQDAFDRGLALQPDVIATDAGSTDSGPYYLGAGVGKYSEAAIRRCVRQLVKGAEKLSVPLLIGSCNTSGTDSGVDELERIVREVCQEENISGKKIVKIYTEQRPEKLKRKFQQGKIRPLKNAPDIDENTFDECSHIVGLGGAEHFIKALKMGADIVLCGRCTDTAIIAAYPIMKGCHVGATWHGAKTAECGPACTTQWSGTGVVLTVDETGFSIEATAENASCTPYTVSAHMLYENSDPFVLVEPGTVIDVRKAVYKQLENGIVRVEGSQATPAPYTMKLEGSGSVGFQTVALVGIQDREVMADPMRWIEGLKAYTKIKLQDQGFPMEEFTYDLKAYGFNAVSGTYLEPGTFVPREIAVLLTVTAKTQELATEVAKTFNPYLLHYRVGGGEMPSFAFPFSPNEIEKGNIYEFKLNHIVAVDEVDELVRYAETTI